MRHSAMVLTDKESRHLVGTILVAKGSQSYLKDPQDELHDCTTAAR